MQARFLLGPAGSGKTHRCLSEIRTELTARPDGPPLVLLAPKQATFQLERQLLVGTNLAGYTRLRILSFERLAEFVLESLRLPQPRQLAEEGRLMVLRALLAQHADELELFHASARLPGFARQLNLILRELQHHQLLPGRLAELAAKARELPHLQAKLRDLARLLGAYLEWLEANQLQDADALLDFAAESLRNSEAGFHLGGLWLDGFAEMTPQELHLLAAVIPKADRALLAFCLSGEPRGELPWLSTWAVVSQTFRECHARVSALPGVEVVVEELVRDPIRSRYSWEPALAHLEASWADGKPWAEANASQVSDDAETNEPQCESEELFSWAAARRPQKPRALPLRLVACRDAEIEATLAAHEILRHVRDRGGRFRDCAVLLRSLEGYHDILRRVFARREIPCFLDRRESVSHHPLAELTRFSLRLAAYGWLHDDWFGALKTGLVSRREADLDRLENAALEFGWEGNVWRQPLRVASRPELEEWAEPLRAALVPPFLVLNDRVRGEVDGRELAAALRELWEVLEVESTLDHWSAELPLTSDGAPAVHDTVWEQMQVWLENLELAFSAHAMRVLDWLPILEAGLANLSVGVIPPALDQVLIGTVDRSRNPELQLVILPGFSEAVFPAPSPSPGLLTEPERDALAGLGARLGPGILRRIGHERYYGYIACTRARQRLVVTHAVRDGEGGELHPSVFAAHLQKLFPTLTEEQANALPARWQEAEHTSELVAPLLRHVLARRGEPGNAADGPPGFGVRWLAGNRADTALASPNSDTGCSRSDAQSSALLESGVCPHPSPTAVQDAVAPDLLLTLPGLERVLVLLERLPRYPLVERLSPELAAALYLQHEGERRVFRSSVSRLETFAACPFRFFVETGLRAEERKQFEVDQRERGSLQHEVLERFHLEITRSGRRWRDVSPDEAAELIGRLVDESARTYREGLFFDDERNQFTAATLKDALQKFIRAVIGWMRSYQLDPTFAEVSFGMGEHSILPAWRIPLGEGCELALRGKVDRVDLGSRAESKPWCVVLDYKSGEKKLDAVQMHNGLQLQLPAYLAAIESFAHAGLIEGCGGVRPAGMFYANLRGTATAGASRDDVLGRDESSRAAAYQHYGRFNLQALGALDAGAASAPSGQFNFKLNKDGTPGKRQADPMDGEAFAGLLAGVRTKLEEFAHRILAGEAAVDPYRMKRATACDRCELAAVCRIEARTHRFRSLAQP